MGRAVSVHRSLQSINDTLLAMKRGLDSLIGKSDETSNKQPRQAYNADDGSPCTSDVDDIVDTYLEPCQPGGGAQKGTIPGKI